MMWKICSSSTDYEGVSTVTMVYRRLILVTCQAKDSKRRDAILQGLLYCFHLASHDGRMRSSDVLLDDILHLLLVIVVLFLLLGCLHLSIGALVPVRIAQGVRIGKFAALVEHSNLFEHLSQIRVGLLGPLS